MAIHRKSREKAAKKIPGTPVFFNGSLKLLLLPADNRINFIIGTAESVPFSTWPEKDAPPILLISSVVFQSVMSSPPWHHKDNSSDKAGFLPWSTFLPPFQFLCFAYPMYHPASYFSLADMGKHTVFPPISVDFIVFLQSHPSRRS